MTQKEIKSFLDKNIPLKDVIKYLGIAITMVWTAHTYYNNFINNIDSKFVSVNSRIDTLFTEIRNMPKCHCQKPSEAVQTREVLYGVAGIKGME